MFRNSLFAFLLCVFVTPSAFAEDSEFNPFAPNASETLKAFDKAYEASTGLSAYPAGRGDELSAAGCYQLSCPIFVDVDKGSQTLRLYLDGRLADQWDVSTGRPGYGTPDFDKHFDGRIYQRYDSAKYPGGDYMGLGNMPYAMFISGGIAIHGTPESNWRNLGHAASHGCIRVHPEHAHYLNQLLRQYGVRNSWVRVH
jgi:hypothetical protein